MIDTKHPKFNWSVVCENNSGHTENEWGTRKAKTIEIHAYTVWWDR